MKDLINKAYEMGSKGFLNGLMNSPCMNKELMEWLSKDFNSWDEEKMKIKFKLYKSYIKGWTDELLKSMVI